MKKGFQTSERIENPAFLFGRNGKGQLLEQLLNTIKRGTNAQLQGERRSGKTSTLKCLENMMLANNTNIIPVFLDFKEESYIKGNANVYRYILAKTIALLTEKGTLKGNLNIRDNNIECTQYWDKVYNNLEEISDISIQEVLKDFFIQTSNNNKISFVILIDEYEWLFLHTFDNDGGFYPLRTLSQTPSNNNIKPFTFIISGAKSWEKFGKDIGSPELNSIGAGTLSVSPLYIEDFTEMWEYYLKKAEIVEESTILDIQKMFEYSGGIPFYAKVIAESVLNNDNINFNILLPHFESVYNNLDQQELNVIKGIIDGKNIASNVIVNKLLDRGILNFSTIYNINGTLFKNYIIQKITKQYIDTRQLELSDMVKKMQKDIREINENSNNKKREYIFTPTNEYAIYCQNAETICLENDVFQNFANALYRILFEHTKRPTTTPRPNSLEKLPTIYRNKNIYSIIKIIDSVRQLFVGHDTSNPSYQPSANQILKADLLQELLRSKSEPYGDDFYKMQKEVLNRFLLYLEELLNFVRNNATW